MSTTGSGRPEFFRRRDGQKVSLPFSSVEYERRLDGLRQIMAARDLDAVLLTSMHNIAYYSGFLYCSFGRPYGCVVTQEACTTVSANIDASQPWRRSIDDNVIYTDWKRDNYWRAVRSLTDGKKHIGIEADHLTLQQHQNLEDFLGVATEDISGDTMRARMVKSAEEIELIKHGAAVADIGGFAIRDAIAVGATELEIAAAGRNAMEAEIARRFPEAEYRDTWVWFQSGLNTDGAHNPVTNRMLEAGDILSLNTFPMISGYYTALERTLFLGEPDAASRKIWEANVEAHELGISLIKAGATCSGICAEINRLFETGNLLRYRSFGYGHSFGILSHYYGREAGLELREDIDTVLEPGMVISMEPMLWIPEGEAGAGGYREHDILVIGENGEAENITKFPYGPDNNIIAV
ncbi:MAG: aminopeptidase P family protein [Pseudomonadota bacterium]